MEARDVLKKKMAQKLVEKGLMTQEDLDMNYDHISLADMADVYTKSKKIIKIEGPSDFAQWSTAKQEQFIAALQKMGAVEALKSVSDFSDGVRARNNDVWIDPKSDRGQIDTVRAARQDILDQINDYGSVLLGDYENPEDHRNLALGSSGVKIAKDILGLGMSLVKWNTQFLGEAIGGVNGADVGRAVPDVVIIVTGAVGAAKGVAAAGKATVNLGKAAGTITKDAAKTAGRATGLLKEAPVVTASEKVGQYFGNVPESYKFQSEIFKDPITWTAPNGTKQTYKVYTRNDIDWNHIRTDGPLRFQGKTNLEAAAEGFAPQLPDGYFATLHHIGQNGMGPLSEASTRYHGFGKDGQEILHGQFGPRKPNPDHPIQRNSFNAETREYWKSKAKE